jgi:hypothetical protein
MTNIIDVVDSRYLRAVSKFLSTQKIFHLFLQNHHHHKDVKVNRQHQFAETFERRY